LGEGSKKVTMTERCVLIGFLILTGINVAAFVSRPHRHVMLSQKSFMSRKACKLNMNKPFFASEETSDDTSVEISTEAAEKVADVTNKEESIEDIVNVEVQKELKKSVRVSNLRNANGVDYAPWMRISEDDEKEIRQMVESKTKARVARKEQEKSVSGNLYYDSQAQELSGTGLNWKAIDGAIEIEWATKTEKNTQGYVVKRRAAKTTEFAVMKSFKDYGPLVSKGENGGIYRYLDDTVTPGGWVYRVSECDSDGNENDLCQCLVEVQTEEEQKAALFAAIGIGVFAIGSVVAGLVLDPLNGSPI